MSAADFADRYWSRAPLLTPAPDRTAFTDLFSVESVDELVSVRGLRTPFLRMAKNGAVLPPTSYTRSGGSGASIADQVADDKVLAQFADGATLVLQALHRTWPPLVRFGSELAAELGHPVQINAYVTPAQNQGFAAHYDTHDVFVLQVAGSKRWTIHAPVFDDPLERHTWDRRRAAVESAAAGQPLIDTVLQPGDALYLPRGYLHSAVAQGDVSVHLTVGIHPVTAYELVSDLLAAAAEDRELRRSLPVGVDLTDPAVLAGHLTAAADRLAVLAGRAAEGGLASLANRVARHLVDTTRPQPLAPLAQLRAIEAVHSGTKLSLRRGLRPAVEVRGERVVLRAIDSTVTFPVAVEQALKTVLTSLPFTPADLAGLDDDERLVVARRLLREGVVVPADEIADAGTLAGGPDRVAGVPGAGTGAKGPDGVAGVPGRA